MKQSGFSPQARWDRNIPTDERHPEFLNEKIECVALFKAGKIYPQKFIWNNKEYEIKTITYNWQERHGQEIISYFSVSTGTDLYQISFNNTTLAWKIDKIIS